MQQALDRLLFAVASVGLRFATPLLAQDYNEGFVGDDVFVVSGQGISRTGAKSETQAKATAVQSAREDAEARFIGSCAASSPAGGACGDMTPDKKTIAGYLRTAKVVQDICEKSGENSNSFACRVRLRVQAKGLKQLCEKLKTNSAPSCTR